MLKSPEKSKNSVSGDPLKEVKRATVAIGKLSNFTALSEGEVYFDGSTSEFEVVGTGFVYAYTPIQFSKGKSQPDPKTGAIYYWAKLWVVTCTHCLADCEVAAIRIDTKSGQTRGIIYLTET